MKRLFFLLQIFQAIIVPAGLLITYFWKEEKTSSAIPRKHLSKSSWVAQSNNPAIGVAPEETTESKSHFYLFLITSN